jgi:serine/threonine protein kinase
MLTKILQNYLPRVINNGPAWYRAGKVGDKHEAFRHEFKPDELVPLRTFLDFAVGATECLEILHHGQRIVHGEIRGDAFHMNPDTGQVKLINFGSGLRTFEHGLTSSGWSTLSKEVGAKTKLSYMSPEQTGRMPAEPDSRTDIYSLGVLFWTLLTQQSAYGDCQTPMDIIQAVLSRRLPSVSSIRMDVPDVIGRIIQKMTAKTIGERYHSVSGLRYDLMEIRKLLGDGNSAALKKWQIATRDVSSFFILPTFMIGRAQEHDEVVKIIDKVSRRHKIDQRQDVYSMSSGSSLSEGRQDTNFDASVSVGGSSEGENASSFDGRSNSLSVSHTGASSDLSPFPITLAQTQSGGNSQHNSAESQNSIRSDSTNIRRWEKTTPTGIDSRSGLDSVNGVEAKSNSDGVGSLTSKNNSQKFRRKGRCELVAIAGAPGLGKSCLVQSVQVEARRRGYFGE